MPLAVGVSRVLVVGGTGLLGQYVVREALSRGHETVGTHRGEATRPSGESRVPLNLVDPHAIAQVVAAAKPKDGIDDGALHEQEELCNYLLS